MIMHSQKTEQILNPFAVGAPFFVKQADERGLGRGLQALEMNSRDSPSAFPHSLFVQETAQVLAVCRGH